MSDVALRSGSVVPAFSRRSLLALVGGGIALFLLLMVLFAHAPQWRGADNGRANALSNGATGFAGIVALARATGRHPQIVRNDRDWSKEGLLVVTPEDAAVNIGEAVSRRSPTLVVFPKWQTDPLKTKPGWVSSQGPLPPYQPEGIFAPARVYDIRRAKGAGGALSYSPDLPEGLVFEMPERLQTIVYPQNNHDASGRFEPLITDRHGGIVLGRDGDVFVLADPDLINNKGLADAGSAASALALIDAIDPYGGRSVMYDVSLNGYGATPDVLTLAFSPPFLAMTLALLAVAVLVGARAIARFGAPAPRERALALGSTALTDSTAALFRKAGRTWALGDRYADAVRQRAARDFGAPAHLKGRQLDEYLDRLGGNPRFSDRARSADAARSDDELLGAARALADWKKDRTA